MAQTIFAFDFIYLTDYSDELVLHALRINAQIVFISYSIIFVLYGAVLESSQLKGTIGKRFVGFSVTDTSLNRISFLKALLRNIVKLLAVVTVAGVAMIDMVPTRQALHDVLLKTHLMRR